MKKQISILSGIVAFMVLAAFKPVTDIDGFYRIDPTASKIEWSGSKITGKQHTGTVNLMEGGLQFTGGVISNGKFAIDMTTINVTDLEGGMKEKLESHLKGEDFFGVDKHKVANLAISGVEGDKLKANLTIKGITHEVTFPVKVVQNTDGTITATADIEVDRSKYDVRYGSGSFFDDLGDKAIDDIIKFHVTLKGSK
ncbi:MAG: YceI family protein [Flavobacteriales bacterium]|nr:YceI family protein [Flavobacteriales bacterium]